MEKLLNVSSSPHVRDKSSTKSIMRDVCIALIPATLVGIGNFGVRALLGHSDNMRQHRAGRVCMAEINETKSYNLRF